MTFKHPVHGDCEVIDKAEITERTKSVLVRRVKDDAKLYVSSSYFKQDEVFMFWLKEQWEKKQAAVKPEATQ